MNLSVAADDSFSRWSLFSRRQELSWAKELIERLGIRTSSPQQNWPTSLGGISKSGHW